MKRPGSRRTPDTRRASFSSCCFTPAATTLPAASNTTSRTGTPSRRPSSRARSTEMPVGSARDASPPSFGRAASTALPTLIAARSVPLGARSETAAAGGFWLMDEHAPTRHASTHTYGVRISPPYVRRVLEVRRRVDHHHAHLVRGGLEAVRLVGREKAGLAGAHFELLAR